MTLRSVYDTMVFLSWVAGDARKLATVQALYDGTVRLVISQEAIDEIRDVLGRVEVQTQLGYTPERVEMVIDEMLRLAEWVRDVPNAFTWPHHPDDDHNFNLAIAAKADRLVTRERRIRGIEKDFPGDWTRLHALAPELRIVEPNELAAELRAERPNLEQAVERDRDDDERER